MATIIYGISNCDKCRAALKWFRRAELEHQFHDLRTDGIDKSLLKNWLHPTLVKRPLVDTGSELLVGYDEDAWQNLLT